MLSPSRSFGIDHQSARSGRAANGVHQAHVARHPSGQNMQRAARHPFLVAIRHVDRFDQRGMPKLPNPMPASLRHRLKPWAAESGIGDEKRPNGLRHHGLETRQEVLFRSRRAPRLAGKHHVQHRHSAAADWHGGTQQAPALVVFQIEPFGYDHRPFDAQKSMRHAGIDLLTFAVQLPVAQ